MISENNWKATKWGICVHLFNISFFFGCKQLWINTKAKRKMYFSVKRLILNAWESFARSLKGYFYYVVVLRIRKLVIKTRWNQKRFARVKLVWKLRRNGIIMVFMIFSFFLRTIKHEYTLFKTRKMIFSTRTFWT